VYDRFCHLDVLINNAGGLLLVDLFEEPDDLVGSVYYLASDGSGGTTGMLLGAEGGVL
jgi:hypothetical protein